jgi:hypothetical protein
MLCVLSAGFFAAGATGASAQEFMSVEITPDVRSAGMASGTLALDATPFSPALNMAAVPLSDNRWSAAYGFTSWLGRDNLHSASGWGRIGKRHSLGASFRWLAREPMETTEDGVIYRTVKPRNMIADVGYACAIASSVSFGLGMRYIDTGPEEITLGRALAGNLSFQYREKGWRAALVLDNLGARLGRDGGAMRAILRAGAGYQHLFAGRHRLSCSLQADYRFMPRGDGYLQGGAGVEYAFTGWFAVRGGYHLGDRERSLGNYGSVGASLFLGPVSVDAAYLIITHPMGDIWHLGVGVEF